MTTFIGGVACSGGDDEPGQRDGASAALANRDCYLGLQVPGVTHTGFACSGTDTLSSVTGLKPNTFEPALRVSITLAEAPVVGDLALSELSIEVTGDDSSQRWEADVSACSAVAVASAVEEDFGWVYFWIDISCSEPAMPDGDTADPLEVGDFAIVTFFSED